MPATIVFGGQFGSEGKGKVAHFFAKEKNAKVAVRVGGPNSGHTIYDSNGNRYIFKMLPTASILENVDCLMPSGSYLDLDILFNEIKMTNLDIKRLKIDPNAIIITKENKEDEANSNLRQEIGSTLSGTGKAVVDRICRNRLVLFAKNEPRLKEFLTPTKEYLRNRLDRGENIIIEGTQGYGLSVLHSEHYPYVTSRDTSAAGFLSEVGLSPLDVKDVVLVIRAFPIRVSGNSGPLPHEIGWADITKESGALSDIIEYTSVTNCVRRVGRFSHEIVKKAIIANNPSLIVLNHVDYIGRTVGDTWTTNVKVANFIEDVQCSINRKINYIGTSPQNLIKI